MNAQPECMFPKVIDLNDFFVSERSDKGLMSKLSLVFLS